MELKKQLFQTQNALKQLEVERDWLKHVSACVRVRMKYSFPVIDVIALCVPVRCIMYVGHS